GRDPAHPGCTQAYSHQSRRDLRQDHDRRWRGERRRGRRQRSESVTVMEFLTWLEQTEFSTWLRESDWGHPIVLCFHAVGMGLVVGISIMFSARVLGYSKDFPLAAFDKLFGLAWFGFAMNAVSGALLFIGEPRRLLVTPAFWIKMILIVLAGFSVWILTRILYGAEHRFGP